MMVNDDRTNARAKNDGPNPVARPKRFGLILCAGVLLALCFATRFSPAQTAMELTRWKEFSYARRSSQLGGRITGLNAMDRSGFIMLGDGGFGQLSSSIVQTNSPEGKAFYQGFVMYDFPDGSSILAKVDVSGEARGKQVGTITFLSGTKRFKGITGRGTLSSWMPVECDMYAEIEASYSVSEK
jgi:hypothetical protein